MNAVTRCLIGHLLVLAAVAAPQPVGQWERCEVAVTNAKPYRDPYREVTLEAIFTRPDRSQVRFWGFHDGGQTWRLRFMPDQIGTWSYVATFSDGSPGASGSFACGKSELPGLLTVHEKNPVWFGCKGAAAILIRGLHIGDRFFARNWDDPSDPGDGEKRAAFLDWAQAQGYNTLSVASHYLNRASEGRGAGWATPALWPPNPAEFARLETILDDLARRRLLVYPFAGFFGRDSNFPTDPADQTLYLRYVYARLGPYWNLFLNAAGPEPLLRGKPFLPREEVNRLGTEIQRWNVFAKPLSVHNRTGDDEFRDEPWVTYGTLQGPKTIDPVALHRGLIASHHPRKPLLAQETLWSGNVNHIRRNDRDYTDAELRQNAYVIHFSGAGLVFADNDGDSSSGFSGTLDPSLRRQPRHDIVKRVWDTLATLPWQGTAPHAELVTIAGEGASFCLADPGRTYLVYLTSRVTVSVRVSGGPYQVEWRNAQDPADRRRARSTPDGTGLAAPAAGDWILVLTK